MKLNFVIGIVKKIDRQLKQMILDIHGNEIKIQIRSSPFIVFPKLNSKISLLQITYRDLISKYHPIDYDEIEDIYFPSTIKTQKISLFEELKS